MTTVSKYAGLVLLHADDNIAIACRDISAGEELAVGGGQLTVPQDIALGHKIARHDLRTGDKVFRFGMAIGSMTADAPRGSHVHLHNMKSDYIATHSREAAS